MLFFLIFSVIMLFSGIFFTALVIQSKNPDNLIYTTGELTKKKGFKNYKLNNRTVPNAVEYTYTYEVKGKSYHLYGVQHTHARNLHKRITIVYLRSFPHFAYEECFTGDAEWLLAISFSAMGILLLLLYFFTA
ncbi:MAG: hypothetical protein ACI3VZ_09265 [Faecousia sp.]